MGNCEGKWQKVGVGVSISDKNSVFELSMRCWIGGYTYFHLPTQNEIFHFFHAKLKICAQLFLIVIETKKERIRKNGNIGENGV